MNTIDFDALRDLPKKTIAVDLQLAEKAGTSPLLTASRIPIVNSAGENIVLNVNYNPETDTKGINVTLVGVGPICRLDVDGTCHGNAGRSHKHAVQDERSINRKLRDGVTSRSDLAGKGLQEVFDDFCTTAKITHNGKLELP